MEVEFIEKDENKAVLVLKNVPVALVNSIRRAMMSYVPTMAVDYINVYMNTSYLFDEILAHRIGLIPIKTDVDKFNFPDKCECGGEGCPRCQVSLRLNAEGPKTVYSGEFVSDDPETKPVYDNVPVVKLYEGQQLMIEAVARLGIGKEHAKWKPVSVCAYKILPEIRIDEKCNVCRDCVLACPRQVLEINDGKISVRDPLNCSMCMECTNVCEENAISVEETDNYLFTIESVGSMPALEIFRRGVEVLMKKAEEMNKSLEYI
ncbi:MAG: DNA-directed RNA polymerase subunit D [Archaeoglobus sp.]|nr:MAG: DNA-directed RNA polymerase subunit D [Archaeoglobus sp.]